MTAMPVMSSNQVQDVAGSFDAMASDYDEAWTETTVGQLQRRHVWRQFGAMFQPGQRVLDLGCGTGVDAAFLARLGVRVHAIDVSSRMMRAAQERVEREGLADRVTFEICALEHVAGIRQTGLFDGAVSNFGAINCLPDLQSVARGLASLVRPGGKLALCFMGRFCLWEMAYHVLHAQPRKAFRRLRAGEAGIETSLASGPAFHVYYPSIARLAADFSRNFDLVSFRSIGILVPPSYLERWAKSRQRTLCAFSFLDERIGGWPLVRATGDHRLAVFVRE